MIMLPFSLVYRYFRNGLSALYCTVSGHYGNRRL